MNIPQELLYQQYVRRELETYRAPYDPELEFYSYVRQGNTEKVKELCRESFQEKKGLGILSDSPLQNLKYHFASPLLCWQDTASKEVCKSQRLMISATTTFIRRI